MKDKKKMMDRRTTGRGQHCFQEEKTRDEEKHIKKFKKAFSVLPKCNPIPLNH